MAQSCNSPGGRVVSPRAIFNVVCMVTLVAALHHLFAHLAYDDSYLYWFLALFAWRYVRFAVNLVGFWCYSPSPKASDPTYSSSRDVTAVIPTVDPERGTFRDTVLSCAENSPAKIVIITAGNELYEKTLPYIAEFERFYPSIEFVLDRTQVASKRAQVALAVPHIKTAIAVLLDDHVFWGPNFLESLLSAFKDPKVGLVGTNKRVRREKGLNLWRRFWNMLGATYLCRHNFEIRATNAVDGGVFVISGRTCALRTEILNHPDFLPGYTDEKFLFGMLGPLNPDDDNYNTRFVVSHGWKIKIQYTEDAVMETTLGVEKPVATKFLAQCRRWARTTWRSNICSLVTDRTVWTSQPYCVYAVYLTSLTNFAAITDPLLVYLFTHSSLFTHASARTSKLALAGLVGWILFTKTIKVFDYFRRHPQDIYLFPAYVAFAYFHSLIKLWALLTFWDCTWSGRRLDQIKVDEPERSRVHPRSDSDIAHVIELRSINTRVADLHTSHAEHIARYQEPLLAEVNRLKENLVTLEGGHKTMSDNSLAIGTGLDEILERAKEATDAQDAAKIIDERDISDKIAVLKSA
ncbi:hypothetical protein NEMBOFW57_003745 [Staphylotrichum longicolle]|uniref:Uncharacterized protein n=1 Tax=Staphylotrichum longicolle TaxID=669026 RepID=A0AAD4HZT8_9PEZI|nr:hypothetical protein NEMBOFW57_003745 [Staphylotrichum longicolle]